MLTRLAGRNQPRCNRLIRNQIDLADSAPDIQMHRGFGVAIGAVDIPALPSSPGPARECLRCRPSRRPQFRHCREDRLSPRLRHRERTRSSRSWALPRRSILQFADPHLDVHSPQHQVPQIQPGFPSTAFHVQIQRLLIVETADPRHISASTHPHGSGSSTTRCPRNPPAL